MSKTRILFIFHFIISAVCGQIYHINLVGTKDPYDYYKLAGKLLNRIVSL
jgi:hypothetical protein